MFPVTNPGRISIRRYRRFSAQILTHLPLQRIVTASSSDPVSNLPLYIAEPKKSCRNVFTVAPKIW